MVKNVSTNFLTLSTQKDSSASPQKLYLQSYGQFHLPLLTSNVQEATANHLVMAHPLRNARHGWYVHESLFPIPLHTVSMVTLQCCYSSVFLYLLLSMVVV